MAEILYEDHEHDWRGIDTGRMGAKCGKMEEPITDPDDDVLGDKCKHEWDYLDDGRICIHCEAWEDSCSLCRCVPCQCDAIYESWRDRQDEKDAELMDDHPEDSRG